MLVWKDAPSGPSAPDALNHYAIIRRNGCVVPFEPQVIAVAMMKAFQAVRQTMRRFCTLHPSYLMSTLSSRFSQWYSHDHLEVRVPKMGFSARQCSRRRDNSVLRDGAAGGFFSAAKPNLRNAP